MDDLNRRLERIKRRPTMEGKSDVWLSLCIEDATDFFLEYTNRTIDPGAEADNVICEIALLRRGHDEGQGRRAGKGDGLGMAAAP